jgi:hypothetical protein
VIYFGATASGFFCRGTVVDANNREGFAWAVVGRWIHGKVEV